MDDPLSLNNTIKANETRLTRATPHPEVVGLYERLTDGQYADSLELRVALLSHMIFIAYCDLKESAYL